MSEMEPVVHEHDFDTEFLVSGNERQYCRCGASRRVIMPDARAHKPERWTFRGVLVDEDLLTVMSSGRGLEDGELVEMVSTKITDEMITAAESAYQKTIDDGDHDEAMHDALKAALNA